MSYNAGYRLNTPRVELIMDERDGVRKGLDAGCISCAQDDTLGSSVVSGNKPSRPGSNAKNAKAQRTQRKLQNKAFLFSPRTLRLCDLCVCSTAPGGGRYFEIDSPYFDSKRRWNVYLYVFSGFKTGPNMLKQKDGIDKASLPWIGAQWVEA